MTSGKNIGKKFFLILITIFSLWSYKINAGKLKLWVDCTEPFNRVRIYGPSGVFQGSKTSGSGFGMAFEHTALMSHSSTTVQGWHHRDNINGALWENEHWLKKETDGDRLPYRGTLIIDPKDITTPFMVKLYNTTIKDWCCICCVCCDHEDETTHVRSIVITDPVDSESFKSFESGKTKKVVREGIGSPGVTLQVIRSIVSQQPV